MATLSTPAQQLGLSVPTSIPTSILTSISTSTASTKPSKKRPSSTSADNDEPKSKKQKKKTRCYPQRQRKSQFNLQKVLADEDEQEQDSSEDPEETDSDFLDDDEVDDLFEDKNEQEDDYLYTVSPAQSPRNASAQSPRYAPSSPSYSPTSPRPLADSAPPYYSPTSPRPLADSADSAGSAVPMDTSADVVDPSSSGSSSSSVQAQTSAQQLTAQSVSLSSASASASTSSSSSSPTNKETKKTKKAHRKRSVRTSSRANKTFNKPTTQQWPMAQQEKQWPDAVWEGIQNAGHDHIFKEDSKPLVISGDFRGLRVRIQTPEIKVQLGTPLTKKGAAGRSKRLPIIVCSPHELKDRAHFFKAAKPNWGSDIHGWTALQKAIARTDETDFPLVLDTPTQRGATCRIHSVAYRAQLHAFFDQNSGKMEKKVKSNPELVVLAKDLVQYKSTVPKKIHTHGLGSDAAKLINEINGPSQTANHSSHSSQTASHSSQTTSQTSPSPQASSAQPSSGASSIVRMPRVRTVTKKITEFYFNEPSTGAEVICDDESSKELIRAYKDGLQSVEYGTPIPRPDGNGSYPTYIAYVCDFDGQPLAKMCQKNRKTDSKPRQIFVRQIDKNETVEEVAALTMQEHRTLDPNVTLWADIPAARTKWESTLTPFLHPIPKTHPLYAVATEQFLKTFNEPNRQSNSTPAKATPTISSVECFCNPPLDDQFNAKIKLMEQKARRRLALSVADLESKKSSGQAPQLVQVKHLFHGTKDDNITHILEHGFLPKLSRAHGNLHGQGTYFAKHASYSRSYAVPTYPAYSSAVPGTKAIIVAAVAIGQTCLVDSSGSMNMGALIAGSPIPGDRADTCVDELATDQAQVFCCFDAAQTTPRFLVKFREI